MKRIIYLCCLLSLTACNNKPKKAQTYPTTPTGLKGIQQSGVKSTEQGTNTVALNPAHGQPNHRCDIAVGAPLNTTPSPTAPANQAPVQAIPKVADQISQPENENGQRLNPAHGAPGHKCEIPVGAPLT